MQKIETLKAFNSDEKSMASELLAAKVATMLGRKMEEDDWDFVYCNAKRIPQTNWSNLNVDVNFQGLGVEHKMLRVNKSGSILDACGTTKMHPAGTRSIRVLATGDPDIVASDVLQQYSDLIEAREKAVLEKSDTGRVDMRFGWLLWKETLDEFLYFEEAMEKPIPSDFFAHWNDTPAKGARKASRSLWIYDKATHNKVYSVTTTAGAKIQPYFQVPDPTDPNLYHFVVRGVLDNDGLVEVWLTKSTAKYLEIICGGLDKESISKTIMSLDISGAGVRAESTSSKSFLAATDIAVPIKLSSEAYQKLCNSFENISDEYLFQQLTLSAS